MSQLDARKAGLLEAAAIARAEIDDAETAYEINKNYKSREAQAMRKKTAETIYHEIIAKIAEANDV
jgi:hypothetical protein